MGINVESDLVKMFDGLKEYVVKQIEDGDLDRISYDLKTNEEGILVKVITFVPWEELM